MEGERESWRVENEKMRVGPGELFEIFHPAVLNSHFWTFRSYNSINFLHLFKIDWVGFLSFTTEKKKKSLELMLGAGHC